MCVLSFIVSSDIGSDLLGRLGFIVGSHGGS